jgi:very-short-patch-repair endonuclease
MEELQHRARQLRQNMTEAERTLWHRIRGRAVKRQIPPPVYCGYLYR